jgi:REP element-mobilizing transposase RayT
MTLARSAILNAHPNGAFHCMSRCVRRAFLCGYDRLTGTSYSHRRRWIVERIELLARSFSVSIHAYAIMENHFHIVLQMDEGGAAGWSEREVVQRWLAIYPGKAGASARAEAEVERLLSEPGRVETLRARLANMSWFMRNLKEYIARRSNREDGCTGHFWEGRFKSQAILDDRSLLDSMIYVDLNPVRAGMAVEVEECDFTSGQLRKARLRRARDPTTEPLTPILGQVFPMQVTLAAYIARLDHMASSVHPSFVRTWWRAIGSVTALRALAIRLGQRWIKGYRAAGAEPSGQPV